MSTDDKVKCPVCGKEYCKKGIGTHMWRCHGAGQDFNPNKGYMEGTRQGWSKGLTKETNASIKRASEALKRKKTPLELEINDDDKLKRRYSNKKVNAKAEGIECNLTYDEYCQLVKEAGLVSSQLGFTGEGYVLARYGDTGPYEYGNCRFITQKENAAEKNARLYPNSKHINPDVD